LKEPNAPQTAEEARQRLQVLALDTITAEQRERRTITEEEHYAIPRLLDELHRLHIAVSEQRAQLATAHRAKKHAPGSRRGDAPIRPRPKPQGKKTARRR
jgi:hypothetical protein